MPRGGRDGDLVLRAGRSSPGSALEGRVGRSLTLPVPGAGWWKRGMRVSKRGLSPATPTARRQPCPYPGSHAGVGRAHHHVGRAPATRHATGVEFLDPRRAPPWRGGWAGRLRSRFVTACEKGTRKGPLFLHPGLFSRGALPTSTPTYRGRGLSQRRCPGWRCHHPGRRRTRVPGRQ